MSCMRFVSGDDRQLAGAKVSALEVVDISASVALISLSLQKRPPFQAAVHAVLMKARLRRFLCRWCREDYVPDAFIARDLTKAYPTPFWLNVATFLYIFAAPAASPFKRIASAW